MDIFGQLLREARVTLTPVVAPLAAEAAADLKAALTAQLESHSVNVLKDVQSGLADAGVPAQYQAGALGVVAAALERIDLLIQSGGAPAQGGGQAAPGTPVGVGGQEG